MGCSSDNFFSSDPVPFSGKPTHVESLKRTTCSSPYYETNTSFKRLAYSMRAPPSCTNPPQNCLPALAFSCPQQLRASLIWGCKAQETICRSFYSVQVLLGATFGFRYGRCILPSIRVKVDERHGGVVCGDTEPSAIILNSCMKCSSSCIPQPQISASQCV